MRRWRPGSGGGHSIPSSRAEIRFLLDEHYPAWLAYELVTDGIDAVALNARPELRGVDDQRVLEAARTRPGLNRLRKALAELVTTPPDGLGKHPIVWWLANPD